MKLLRVVVLVFLAGFSAWLARLVAHGKIPLPEGRWREVAAHELRPER